MQGEDLAYPTNRVDLDPTVRDVRGSPAPRVTYHGGRHERAASAHHGPRLAAILKAMGAQWTSISTSPGVGAHGGLPIPESLHVMGTTRMGEPGDVGRRRLLPGPRARKRGRLRLVGVRHRRGLRPDVDARGPGRADGRLDVRHRTRGGRLPPSRRSANPAGKEEGPGDGPPRPLATAATSGPVPWRPGTWRTPALAAQLDAGLVDEAEPVEPAARQLTSGGVEGKPAVTGDDRAVFDEGPRLATPTEPEGLEPDHREDREPVVELG